MASLVCGAAALFHIVLVHGAGGGAYFWFKFANLLLESGYNVTALDLKAAGADTTDHVNVKSFQYYNMPLLQLLSQLPPEKKVVLIAHSWGGVNVAHAMELYPRKIQLAVFVAASLRPTSADATPAPGLAYDYVYGNGPTQPATGLLFRTEGARQFTYQLTSDEDFLLAIYMRKPVPFAVFKTNFTVSAQNYGSVPLVYVKALEDLVMRSQDDMIARHPYGNLKQVLTLHSDHVVPLSHPSELYKLFTGIVSTHLCSGDRASN